MTTNIYPIKHWSADRLLVAEAALRYTVGAVDLTVPVVTV